MNPHGFDACAMIFASSEKRISESATMKEEHVRGSLMLSCTTVASIWLSGLGGMLMTVPDASNVQPNFSTKATTSGPTKIGQDGAEGSN